MVVDICDQYEARGLASGQRAQVGHPILPRKTLSDELERTLRVRIAILVRSSKLMGIICYKSSRTKLYYLSLLELKNSIV